MMKPPNVDVILKTFCDVVLAFGVYRLPGQAGTSSRRTSVDIETSLDDGLMLMLEALHDAERDGSDWFAWQDEWGGLRCIRDLSSPDFILVDAST